MKRNKLVEIFTDHTKNFLTSFTVGILLFTIISDGVSSLFWEIVSEWLRTKLRIEKEWFKLGITSILIVLLLLIIYFTKFSEWVKRWWEKPVHPNVEDLNTTFPGLIVLMSPKPDSPAEVAIRRHWNQGEDTKLKHCWIICTNTSLPFATEMTKQFTEEGITQSVVFYHGNYSLDNIEEGQKISLLVSDELLDDPDYIRKLINCIYADAEQKGLDESEIIADYTGATKGASAGVVLACATPGRNLQYISQVDKDENNQNKLKVINISYKVHPVRR